MGGVCGKSVPEDPDPLARQRNGEINAYMSQSRVKEEQEVKLLLLGAGESGKSTVFKQMKIIHHNGLNPQECMTYRSVIRTNVLNSIRSILLNMRKNDIGLENEANMPRVAKIESISDQQVLHSPEEVLTVALGGDIALLWRDGGVQKSYAMRSEYQLIDSAEYYLRDVERFCVPTYAPSQQDVLRSRMRTTGIVEAEFTIDSYKFRMTDVGGQRNERRKWIHVFECVTAVIFVVAISEYDQRLFEEQSQNRMIESLQLFDEVCNNRFFRNTPVVMFFNKEDLFLDKIKKVDLRKCFPEYTGGPSASAAKAFIMQKFMDLNKNKSRAVYTHFTTATDTGNMKVVLDTTKHIILTEILRRAQLI